MNTESALRMQANPTHIDTAQVEHSGPTVLVRRHHLNNNLTGSPIIFRENSRSMPVSRAVSTGGLAASSPRLVSYDARA